MNDRAGTLPDRFGPARPAPRHARTADEPTNHTMKAVRKRGTDVLLDTDSPDPTPEQGCAIVRPTRLAVGPADLAAVRGEIDHEGVLGHRFVGVVELAPAGAGERLTGKRVVGNINVADASSELARRGLANHDPERRILGLKNMDGCFAERFSIPASNLVPVPDAIDDDHAVFAEPLAAAVHASRIVHLEGKGFVTVLGDTLAALLCSQVMEPLNNTVRLLGHRPERFSLAEKWGVRHRHVEEVGLRADQDVVIVCTGSPADFARAARMVRPRGKIVLKAEPTPVPSANPTRHDNADIDLTPIIENEIEVFGARCGSVADAIGQLSAGAIDLTGLITKRFRFDDAIAAIRAAAEPEQNQVVIDC